MTSSTVRINGLTPLLKKLETLEQMQGAKRGLAEAANLLHSKLATYPPVRTQAQPFKTKKQRAYFFYALKKGLITVPYRRDGNLGKRWTVQGVGTMRVVVGINRKGWAYVQGGKQSKYHEGNWLTVNQAAKDNRAAVLSIIKRRIAEASNG
jgi:hypothetical protein